MSSQIFHISSPQSWSNFTQNFILNNISTLEGNKKNLMYQLKKLSHIDNFETYISTLESIIIKKWYLNIHGLFVGFKLASYADRKIQKLSNNRKNSEKLTQTTKSNKQEITFWSFRLLQILFTSHFGFLTITTTHLLGNHLQLLLRNDRTK